MASSTRGAVSLADLAALNQELAALVRAGVPLEPALAQLANELPGRLGRFADDVAKSLAAGKSLADAVAEREADVGPLYRAIVEAGVRSGRLSVALDGMAATCRRLVDMRRSVTVALIYPLFVALLTIPAGLFLGFYVLPRIRVFHTVVEAPASWEKIEAARQAIPAWAPATGAVFGLLGIVWWIWSRRSFSIRSGSSAAASRVSSVAHNATRPGYDWLSWLWLPRMARGLRLDGRLAALADVLAELVGAGTALPQALRLAGDSSGEPELAAAAGNLAARIEQGSAPSADDPALAALPRLLVWALNSSSDAAELERMLRHVAETYRASADQRAEWLRDYLPAMLAVSIGGTAVFSYALWLFVPWARTLFDIANSAH